MSKTLSYKEFLDLAKANYARGGVDFVECWEEYQFNYFVDTFGPITEAGAKWMFKEAMQNEGYQW